MLQAIQFPTGIAHLDTSLANVDRNTLPLHGDGRGEEVRRVHRGIRLKLALLGAFLEHMANNLRTRGALAQLGGRQGIVLPAGTQELLNEQQLSISP